MDCCKARWFCTGWCVLLHLNMWHSASSSLADCIMSALLHCVAERLRAKAAAVALEAAEAAALQKELAQQVGV